MAVAVVVAVVVAPCCAVLGLRACRLLLGARLAAGRPRQWWAVAAWGAAGARVRGGGGDGLHRV